MNRLFVPLVKQKKSHKWLTSQWNPLMFTKSDCFTFARTYILYYASSQIFIINGIAVSFFSIYEHKYWQNWWPNFNFRLISSHSIRVEKSFVYFLHLRQMSFDWIKFVFFSRNWSRFESINFISNTPKFVCVCVFHMLRWSFTFHTFHVIFEMFLVAIHFSTPYRWDYLSWMIEHTKKVFYCVQNSVTISNSIIFPV